MSSTTYPRYAVPSRALSVSLWGAQALLALAFGIAGAMKLLTPLEALAAQMPWVDDVPGALVRLIALSELAGAIGLLAPSLTRIRPALTPLAALGLALVMALAGLFHLSRGEAGMIAPNVVLGGLALFVAWGRGRRAPIAPRR